MINVSALHVISLHTEHDRAVTLQLEGRLVDDVIWPRHETPHYLSASAPVRLIIYKLLATNTSYYFVKCHLTSRIVEANSSKLQ